MNSTFTFFVICFAIIGFSRWYRAHAKAREEASLLERNPDAWKKVKELELETKDRNRRMAGGAAFGILKFLLKK